MSVENTGQTRVPKRQVLPLQEEASDLQDRSRLHVPAQLKPEMVRAVLSRETITKGGERCPTCHDTLYHRFCRRCGAQAPSASPQSVWAFFQRGVARLLDADSRLLRTVRLLFSRPGQLTVHYLRGNRKPYINPVQLFALVNLLIIFLSVSGFMRVLNTPLRYHVSATSFYHENMAERWVNARIEAPEGWSISDALAVEDSLRRATGRPENDALASSAEIRASLQALESFRAYEDRFERRAQMLSESLVFLLIPMLVVPLGILSLRQRGPRLGRGVLVHLVQATHVTAVWFLIFPATAILASAILTSTETIGLIEEGAARGLLDSMWSALSCLMIATYVAFSVRCVHRTSWAGAIFRGTVIGFLLIPCLQVYRVILFVVGFYTT